ncbi:hypothetical protein [Pelagibacterium sp.]|uniref:hypothetical protein n=1 Tax=Pelagibacterium sp. TaxID=1967288 RepID=UPI003A8D153B
MKKISWVNLIEVLWLVASLYLGSQLTFWLGASFFEHAFAVIAVASPVWLARLLVLVERRMPILIACVGLYGAAAFAVSPTFYRYGGGQEHVPLICAAVFAILVWLQRQKAIADSV